MARIVRKFLLTFIGLFLLSITTGSIDVKSAEDQQLQQQRYYDIITYEFVEAVSSYIVSYNDSSQLSAKLIVSLSDTYNISLKFILAQAHLESHFGKCGLARRTNSIFNVGAYDNGQIKHQYEHPNESVEPYLQLLQENYLKDKTEEELLEQFTDYKGDRYASNKRYEKDLIRIIHHIESKTVIADLDLIRKNIIL